MKRTLSIVLSLLVLIGTIPFLSASAASVDDLKFRLNADKTGYIVSARDWSVPGALKIPASYQGLPVTEIAEEGFRWCSETTSLTIPDSVITVGKKAFYDCDALKSVAFGNGVKTIGDAAFSSCDSLSSVTFGDSVTTIGKYAFSGTPLSSLPAGKSLKTIGDRAFQSCSKLVSVAIPNAVTTVGYAAFCGCASLKKVTIGKSLKKLGGGAFAACNKLSGITVHKENTGFCFTDNILFSKDKKTLYVALRSKAGKYAVPSSVTAIVPYAFYKCNKLTGVSMGNAVTTIGEHAFSGCNNLLSVSMGNGVTTIGDYAFASCSQLSTGLTTVKFGKSVASIGKGAFYRCNTLKSVTLPASLKAIGESAFSGCGMETITIPASVTSIGETAFYQCFSLKAANVTKGSKSFYSLGGVLYSRANKALLVCPIEKTGTVVVPDSITTIASCAFSECSHITGITLGKSVTTIKDGAFTGCGRVTSIALPASLKTIGDYAFFCSSLTSVKIGNAVTSIGKEAFAGSRSVTKITLGKALKTVGEQAFCGSPKVKSITIPTSVTKIGDKAFGYQSDDNFGEKRISGFTIYGISGTAANTYATKNGFKFASTCKHTFRNCFCTKCGEWQLKGTAPKLSAVKNDANGVTLKWGKLTGATGYYIYRKTTGSWSRIATVKSGTVSSYLDKTAKSGTKYTYTVKGFCKTQIGSYNKTGLSLQYLACPKITLANAVTGITVKWGKIGGAKGYVVYRRLDNGTWAKIGTVSKGSAVSYTDTTVKSKTTYVYTVKAYSDKSVSFHSPLASLEFLTAPKLVAATGTDSGIRVSWEKVPGADGYRLYRNTNGNGWVRVIDLKGEDTLCYEDPTALKRYTHVFTVRAYSGTTFSAYDKTGLTYPAE